MKKYQKFEQACANAVEVLAAKISRDINTFECTALRFDSTHDLCVKFCHHAQQSLLGRLMKLQNMGIHAAKSCFVYPLTHFDVAAERQLNSLSARFDYPVSVSGLNEVQIETCFKIDPIDFGFTDVAYGAWKPRIV